MLSNLIIGICKILSIEEMGYFGDRKRIKRSERREQRRGRETTVIGDKQAPGPDQSVLR